MTVSHLKTNFGVSPAFVFSRHTTAFTIADTIESVRAAKGLGFTAIQPEIFRRETVGHWVEGGGRMVAAAMTDQGMAAPQFVGHFLLENFASIERLSRDSDNEDLKRSLEAASAFRNCPVFTVPQAPFSAEPRTTHTDAWALLVAKIGRYRQLIEAAGFTMALEVLNGSLVANTDGFLRLAADLGDDRLGLNLDTGHAWAARENLVLLPSKLGKRLVGLHLKDNDGNLNLSLAPGKGTIPWRPFLAALNESGYAGSLDLEIACDADRVAGEYAGGLAHLRTILHQTATP